MKFRLNVKIYIFSIIVLLGFIVSMFFSIDIANKEFENYIHQKELQNIGRLAEKLTSFYSQNGGWESLKQNRDLWGSLIKEVWLVNEIRHLYPEDTTHNKDEPDISVIYHSRIPVWDQLNLGPRICLYDENRLYINGQDRYPIENCTLLPIDLDGIVIGWLGLIKGQTIYQPLDQAFRHSQSLPFYIIGAVFLILLLFIAVAFSRHMLIPITRLAAATEKIGRLRFSTRIPVDSSDEIGELAKHFNDMAQKLEIYEKNQKQWLTDLSHELRTPLSSLICEIEALKDGIRMPNKELFVSLSHEMRHLIKLVNDINDISLIEAGAFKIKNGFVKPLPILSQEVHVFTHRLENNGITLKIELEQEAADLQIVGDENRLIQLFKNILENAIRHTEKPGRLTIRQTRDMEFLKLAFEDSGPGVPDEALPYLFNRLYRVDSSRSRKTGGNGLGLAICKSIVAMHNGKISGRNVTGGGFVVEILLPTRKQISDATDMQSGRERRTDSI